MRRFDNHYDLLMKILGNDRLRGRNITFLQLDTITKKFSQSASIEVNKEIDLITKTAKQIAGIIGTDYLDLMSACWLAMHKAYLHKHNVTKSFNSYYFKIAVEQVAIWLMSENESCRLAKLRRLHRIEHSNSATLDYTEGYDRTDENDDVVDNLSLIGAKAIMRRLSTGLSDYDKELARLHFIDGLTSNQIADKQDKSRMAIKSRLWRIVGIMRKNMARNRRFRKILNLYDTTAPKGNSTRSRRYIRKTKDEN